MSKEKKMNDYRYYITDALVIMIQSIYDLCGKDIDIPRYYDLVNEPVKETRTAEEVKKHIIEKLDAIVAEGD